MENLTNHKNLKLLWWLRNLAIAGQSAAIVIATGLLAIPLSTHPLWLIILGLIAVNAGTSVRLRQHVAVTRGELFGHLVIDVVALFGLLYFTGGASNPFTSLFIMQVVIAAIALPPFFSWSIAALTIALYSVLMFRNVAVPDFHHHDMAAMNDAFSVHIQGMWLSFVLLAVLVAAFIARIGSLMRRQSQLLAEAEQMAALGALAAAAAHELGTPLASIALLADGWTEDAQSEAARSKAATLSGQVKRCKDILSNITAGAGMMRAEQGDAQAVDLFLNDIISQWQMLRPMTRLDTCFAGARPAPRILAERSLKQAIANLLDNAADASPAAIRMAGEWTEADLKLHIYDRGSGIAADLAQAIGKAGITTKPEGLGLGIYLAKNIIYRLGGTLHLQNHADGAVAFINLPLAKLLV